MNRKQVEASMKQVFDMTKTTKKRTLKVHSVKATKDKMVLEAEFVFISMVASPGAPAGKLVKMEERGRVRDTLVKVKGVWKSQKTESLKAEFKADGKPFNPMGETQVQ